MGLGESFSAGVRDLDAERAVDHVEREAEVPARDTAMGTGVGRQFGHDVLRRVQGKSPGAELLGGEQAGKAGAARCGRQQHAEGREAACQFGGREVGDFLVHVTQRGRSCLP